MTILEILEGVAPRKNFHFTDFISLTKILNSKKLLTYSYSGCKDGEKAFCTVRPSAINGRGLDYLSYGAGGGAKLIIDVGVLSDKVRGSKVRQVAEYNHDIKENDTKVFLRTFDIENNKKNQTKMFNALSLVLKPNAKSKDIIKRAEEMAYYGANFSKYLKPDFKSILKKKVGIEIKDRNLTPKDRIILGELIFTALMKKNNSIEREGEERIIIKGKNNESISLDRSFVKIEITKPSVKGLSDIEKKELKQSIRKNSGYFIKDENYRALLLNLSI